MTERTILGLSGSLRADSHNTALLRAARKFQPDGMDIQIYEGLRDIPPYDLDLDSPDHRPAPVRELRRRVAEADGLLIATPEYNYSIPGVLKNALDWVSTDWTGTEGRPLLHKPIALMGAPPSAFGTARSQLDLRQVLTSLQSDLVLKPEVLVFRSHERFDDGTNLVDDTTIALIEELLDALDTKARARD